MRNILFVGDLILNISCEFYYDDVLRLSSSREAWHIGQQRVVSSVTGRQQQLHIPPM